jgi:sialidase-1
MYSDDDGKSWSKPKDVTKMAQKNSWGWTGLGPVHGIVKQFEPNKGRIIFPSRHNSSGENMVSHVIYSDDNGETWTIGGSVPRPKTTESTVVELSDGRIMLNSRNQSEENYRVVSISEDGGKTFQEKNVKVDKQLIEPRGVQASLLFHSKNKATGKGNIIFSNPEHQEIRSNGTLKLSEDDGRTWTKKVVYAPEPSPYFTGYSDIARFSNGDIAVLYERGKFDKKDKHDRYDEIGFNVVKMSDFQKIGRQKSK